MSVIKPVTIKLDGCTVESMPLLFEESEDLLPDVLQIVTRVLERSVEGILGGHLDLQKLKDATADELIALVPIFAPILTVAANQLGGGALKRLAPRIMATTSVTIKNDKGELERLELHVEKDRQRVFQEHPLIYFPTLFHAGRVTFGPFLNVAALVTKPSAPKKAA